MNDYSLKKEVGITKTRVSEDEKREIICRAAQKVFSRNGFYKTTAQEIADEAGVAVGTLYNYFEDKEDIFIHIFKSEMGQRQEIIFEITESDLSMREKIMKIVSFQLDRARKNKQLMSLVLCEEHHLAGKIGAYMKSLFKELPAKVSLFIAESVGKGDMRKVDPLITAYALMGATRAVIARTCLYDDREAERIHERAAEELTNFFLEGLQPPGSKS